MGGSYSTINYVIIWEILMESPIMDIFEGYNEQLNMSCNVQLNMGGFYSTINYHIGDNLGNFNGESYYGYIWGL